MTRTLHASPLALVKTRAIEWIYEDRIPLRTGTILAGQGGIAKSTIISDIIAKATRGDLPGSFHGTPITVGVISPEDDIESVLVPRLHAARADLSRVVNVSVTVTENERSWLTLPNIGEDLGALGDLVRENGIRLLVVDPLVSVMVGNSISQSDVRRNFDPLSSLAAELEFAVLAVAHFGKTGDRAGDRLSGSHAFRDIARSLIVAAIDEETELRVLTVEKSNYSPVRPSDAYSIETVQIDLDDGHRQGIGRAVLRGASTVTVQDLMDREKDTSTLGRDSQLIIAEVQRHPDGVKAEAIAETLDQPVEHVRRYLNRAVSRGNIIRVRRGVFGPLSDVINVPSVPNSGHVSHIRHSPTEDSVSCLGCGEPLTVTVPGQTTHPDPGCEALAQRGA